jgi:GalNAc-alpha-(1->4)-GalNAc-alpha-(1->3)-diNAcBac-PP-undecaprenol alpha-1,4-N-acetyl-D-galactosaminyltransferase
MKRRKNITLIFNHFEFGREHLCKDVFLVPYYFGKQLNAEVKIVYPRYINNLELPAEHRGVKLISLLRRPILSRFSFWRHFNFYYYLLKNARSIDLLVRFHLTIHTELFCIIYKWLNKKGKVFVKLDINPDTIDDLYGDKKLWLKVKFRNCITKSFHNSLDYCACESLEAFSKIQNSPHLKMQFGKKLLYLPNGFDEEEFSKYEMEESDFQHKENLMITVGRIGMPQKNTSMLLNALSKVALGNWSVYLLGPINADFQNHIQLFYQANPDKIDAIKFIGPVMDRKSLFEYYNRAKVFVLTSDWEGYPIVFPEAKRFRNYIVATNLASSKDVVENDKYGVCVPVNDHNKLAVVLDEIISGKRHVDVYEDFEVNEISWKNLIRQLNIKL